MVAILSGTLGRELDKLGTYDKSWGLRVGELTAEGALRRVKGCLAILDRICIHWYDMSAVGLHFLP